jgi:hypothetical protein
LNPVTTPSFAVKTRLRSQLSREALTSDSTLRVCWTGRASFGGAVAVKTRLRSQVALASNGLSQAEILQHELPLPRREHGLPPAMIRPTTLFLIVGIKVQEPAFSHNW